MPRPKRAAKEIGLLFAIVLAFGLALGSWIWYSKRWNPRPLWSQRVGIYQSQAQFAPDGKHFVVASKGLRFFDSRSHLETAKVAAIPSVAWSFALSPDGHLAATGHYDNAIRLWSLPSGALIRTLKGHDAIPNLAFSPDSKLLASGSWSQKMSRGEIRLWNVASGQLMRRFPDQPTFVSDLAFAPNGKTLFSVGGQGRVKAWNVADGRVVREFVAAKDSLLTVAISPDGKRLAAGGWKQIVHVWNLSSGVLECDLPGDAEVRDLQFAADSERLAVAASTKEASIWNVVTKTKTHRFGGHRQLLYSVCFSPDNSMLLSGGADGEIRLWRVE